MINFRDLHETRQRYDLISNELARRDNQIRELQQRLDSNEGCKSFIKYFGYVKNIGFLVLMTNTLGFFIIIIWVDNG